MEVLDSLVFDTRNGSTPVDSRQQDTETPTLPRAKGSRSFHRFSDFWRTTEREGQLGFGLHKCGETLRPILSEQFEQFIRFRFSFVDAQRLAIGRVQTQPGRRL